MFPCNILYDDTGLLSGYFSVDVYDHAYAEAHAGIVGLRVDIVQALICFRGHAGYDLNMLKARLDYQLAPLESFVCITLNVCVP